MRRLPIVLFTALMTFGGLAVASSVRAQEADDSPSKPNRHLAGQPDANWRNYAPGYGAEPLPQALATLVGGFLTNPCFSGGCYHVAQDACIPGSSCSGGWGGVTAADERGTMQAYRAQSSVSDKAAVSSVMVDPDAPRRRKAAE
ncbi:hypothetical protein [Rhodoblastus sp.]|jgi:hypothetical protein|uniref:hypothetical protein n=1 Tax=Rhodoblastus sp. TaxID=1962975 RepID=UPI0026384280|nr:hypothetical protein [Rhodoblastus sp.]